VVKSTSSREYILEVLAMGVLLDEEDIPIISPVIDPADRIPHRGSEMGAR
jgi:hypothetical protein